MKIPWIRSRSWKPIKISNTHSFWPTNLKTTRVLSITISRCMTADLQSLWQVEWKRGAIRFSWKARQYHFLWFGSKRGQFLCRQSWKSTKRKWTSCNKKTKPMRVISCHFQKYSYQKKSQRKMRIQTSKTMKHLILTLILFNRINNQTSWFWNLKIASQKWFKNVSTSGGTCRYSSWGQKGCIMRGKIWKKKTIV